MNLNSGKQSKTDQPDRGESITLAKTYFRVAQSLMPAVKILASATPPPLVGLALISAHTLECLLKAYLSKDISEKELQKKNLRHNIKVLWKMASEKGLHILSSTPNWVDSLSLIHDTPFYLRYSTKVRGFPVPSAEPMASELAVLLEIVRGQIE